MSEYLNFLMRMSLVGIPEILACAVQIFRSLFGDKPSLFSRQTGSKNRKTPPKCRPPPIEVRFDYNNFSMEDYPCFLASWLTGRPPTPTEIETEIEDCYLDMSDISRSSRFVESETLQEALQQAVEEGLPPLPAAARHFNSIEFAQNQNGKQLFPQDGTSFWGNLKGANFDLLSLSLSDMSFSQDLNQIRCSELHIARMGTDWSFDDMPSLRFETATCILEIENSPYTFKLSDTLADYLRALQCEYMYLTIGNTFWGCLDPKILDAASNKFEYLEIDSWGACFHPGFWDPYPETLRKVFDKEIFIDRIHTSKHKKFREREEARVVLNLDIPPFKRSDLIAERSFPIYWPQHSRYQPQNDLVFCW